MNKFFLSIILLILFVYLFKDNRENFKSKTWGFGFFEIPFLSITMDENP